MNHIATIKVKIKTLLPDGCGCQNERPEGRVEGLANHALTYFRLICPRSLVSRNILAERQCEMSGMYLCILLDTNVATVSPRSVRPRAAAGERPHIANLS